MNLKKIVDVLRRKPLLADILWICILVVPTIVALLNNQYFSMHDDQHVARLFLFDKAFNEGDMYPRWVDMLGFGYGYPLFNFYPPFIYFVAEAFHLIGFSFIWSIKMMIITGFISAAIGMYLLAKSVFNRWSGLLAAALYTYFTYHAVTVYVRGALAEFFTLSVLPFVFLALRNMAEKRTIKSCILFAIPFAILTLTHPLIAFPALLYIAALGGFYYLRMEEKDRKTFFQVGVKGGLLGLGLSAFFWLPSVVEKQFTFVDNILTRELANYKIHFLCIQQFWYSAWGYGGSGLGCNDGMTFQLGKIQLAFVALSIITFVILILQKKLSQNKTTEIIFFGVLLLFTLFMTLDVSGFIWGNISFLWYLQFPWRFLTFAAVFIALLGSGVCYFIMKLPFKELLKEKAAVLLLCIGTIACIFVYAKYFTPQEQRFVTNAQMTNYDEIAWRISRTSFEFVPKGIKTKKSELDTTVLDIDKAAIPTTSYKLISGRGIVEPNESRTSMKSFIVKEDLPVIFQLNTFNFPGWEAYITNSFNTTKSQQLDIDDNNSLKLIRVTLPPGEYILTFIFRDTWIRGLANFITTFSVVTIILFRFRKNKTIDRLYSKYLKGKFFL